MRSDGGLCEFAENLRLTGDIDIKVTCEIPNQYRNWPDETIQIKFSDEQFSRVVPADLVNGITLREFGLWDWLARADGGALAVEVPFRDGQYGRHMGWVRFSLIGRNEASRQVQKRLLGSLPDQYVDPNILVR